jgi:hypothetical protein
VLFIAMQGEDNVLDKWVSFKIGLAAFIERCGASVEVMDVCPIIEVLVDHVACSVLGPFTRVAFWCKKTDESYNAIVASACSISFVKSVYTA